MDFKWTKFLLPVLRLYGYKVKLKVNNFCDSVRKSGIRGGYFASVGNWESYLKIVYI